MNASRRVFGRLPRLARVFAGLTCGAIASPSSAPAASFSEINELVNQTLTLLSVTEGELHGELKFIPERPLAWRFALAPANVSGSATRSGEVSVTGDGASLKIGFDFNPTTRHVNWRLSQGRIELGTWTPALVNLAALPALKEVSANGHIDVSGEGAWSPDDGVTGRLHAELKNAFVRSEAEGWSLENVTVRVGGEIASFSTDGVPLRLEIGAITTRRFGARAFTVNAALKDFARVETREARIEIAGGEVVASPFAVPLSAPVLDLKLTMRRVGLQDIVALIPDTLAEGRGHVDGSIRLGWSEAGGLTVGDGHLSLSEGAPALVRFHPYAGLLTGSLPAAVLKHYSGLRKIETGETPLLAAKLDVRLTPDGDADGRTARVSIEGGPQNPSLVAPLVLTVNVSGPLAPLIKLGSGATLGDAP